MNIRTKEAKSGDFLVVIICIAVILVCILPMVNLLAQSLSSSEAVINGMVAFFPVINRNTSGTTAASEENDWRNWNTNESADWQSAWDNSDSDSLWGNTTDDWQSAWNTDTDSLWAATTADEFDWGSAWDSHDWESEALTDFNTDDLYAGMYGDTGYDDFESTEEYKEWYAMRKNVRDNFRTGATLEQYRYVFLDPSFSRSMWWTAILTIICTFVSLVMTVLCAYPLTYDWLKGKIFLNTMIIFTMYFSAGVIPSYMLMKDLGLLNNPLVLIIPNCLSVFNMIILRSFFFGIPDSLRESAEIDGANPFTVLIRIYLPLSAPVLATLALFYAVGRWNGFSDALLYLSTAPQWVPIQLKLWQLIQNTTSIDVTTVEMVGGSVPRASDAIKAAAIMFATVPILLVYPWLQRYFIAGVTIGAVKG